MRDWIHATVMMLPWGWITVALVVNIVVGYWPLVIVLNFVVMGLALIERRSKVQGHAARHRQNELQRAIDDGHHLTAHLERSQRAGATARHTQPQHLYDERIAQ